MSIGKFIVIEGIDYSGKSTLSSMLLKHIHAAGIECIHTAINSKQNPLTGALNTYVLHTDNQISQDAQSLLFGASITNLVDQHILPILNKGCWVICERYTLSNRVYQTSSTLTNLIACNIDRKLKPDLTIILDITPQEYFKRMYACCRKDNMEDVSESEIVRRRSQYLLHARRDDTVFTVDSTLPPEQILSQVMNLIDTNLTA